MAKVIDWVTIRNDYINGGGSYRDLADKYGVNFSTLANHAAREEWKNNAEEQQERIGTELRQRTAEKIVDAESEIAAIKSRLRLKIYQDLEKRLSASDLDGIEFRRLVQSAKDMDTMIGAEIDTGAAYAKARELLGGIDSAID